MYMASGCLLRTDGKETIKTLLTLNSRDQKDRIAPPESHWIGSTTWLSICLDRVRSKINHAADCTERITSVRNRSDDEQLPHEHVVVCEELICDPY